MRRNPKDDYELLLPSTEETEVGTRAQQHTAHDIAHGYRTSHTRPRPSLRLTDAFIDLFRPSTSRTTTWLRITGCCCVLFLVLHIVYQRRYAYATTGFLDPLQPDGKNVEHLVAAFGPNITSLASVQAELDRRLLSLQAPPSTLHCSWTASDQQKYASLARADERRFFFALNLFNSQAVLPTLIHTLLAVTQFLGPSNTYISIFENGSTDNTTLALAHFAAALSNAGVPHSIHSESRKTDWKIVDRIAQISLYRNYAIRMINSTVDAEGDPRARFKDLIFINDVFTCPRDVLELIWQRREQHADAVCGLDWVPTHSWFEWLWGRDIKYYDNWVGRSITGNLMRSRSDLFAETRDGILELFDQPGEEYSRERFRAGFPVPVYSCWNGMIALDAAPFQADDGSAVSFRSAMDSPGECAASECKTLARDFWVRGLRRWVMVPSVRTTYTQPVYSHPKLEEFAHRGESSPNSLSGLIDWTSVQAPESVVCVPWLRGWHLDLPFILKRFPAH